MPHFDTIVAPITGSGTAAVAVIRLSGPDAWGIAGKVFQPWRPEPLRATYGQFAHGDDGLALPFEEGHSYTGDQVVELSVHGSPASVRAVLDACISGGARMAEPGEFTQRAFLNGRIDLTQAEGVRDTIESHTGAQLRLANLQRAGSLRNEVATISREVGGVLAAVEASVDFSEEIGEFDVAAAVERLSQVRSRLLLLLETADARVTLRKGLRVAIIGPPNAGKSSLLNAILGTERAIVTEIPGTTRDFVEEQIEVDGYPVVLIDTAGLRDSNDPVEAIGVQRSRAIAAGADVVWFVYDATEAVPEENSLEGCATTLVANKCDLARPKAGIAVSAKTREGLGELLASLPLDREIGQREFAINARHSKLLTRAWNNVDTAIVTLHSNRPADLLSVLLQDTLEALGQVTGETATEDMITRIFSDFCIGK